MRSRKIIDLLFSFLQSGDKDLETADLWKLKSTKPVRSPSPHNAFKKWRKAGIKPSESKNAINDSKTKKDKNNEEDMSLLKFFAIVSIQFRSSSRRCRLFIIDVTRVNCSIRLTLTRHGIYRSRSYLVFVINLDQFPRLNWIKLTRLGHFYLCFYSYCTHKV